MTQQMCQRCYKAAGMEQSCAGPASPANAQRQQPSRRRRRRRRRQSPTHASDGDKVNETSPLPPRRKTTGSLPQPHSFALFIKQIECRVINPAGSKTNDMRVVILKRDGCHGSFHGSGLRTPALAKVLIMHHGRARCISSQSISG